jgi:hypothetical protein
MRGHVGNREGDPVMTNAATPTRPTLIDEIMEARQKRAEALHAQIFEAREKIRVHLHPESPSWQREAFDTLHAAHHILGGDPFDMHMRAALEPNERLLETMAEALKKATDKLESAMVQLGSDPEFAACGVEQFRAVLSSYAERKEARL